MSLAPDVVAVQTGARLHFGLLTQGQEAGRRYGGLGLMIDQPG
jgi:predicted sugar kinase